MPSRRSRRSRAATRSEPYACTCASTTTLAPPLPPQHLPCPALHPPPLPSLPPLLFLPLSFCSPLLLLAFSQPHPQTLAPDVLRRVPLKPFTRPAFAQQVQLSPKPVLKLTVSSPSMGAELSYPPNTFTCFDANAEVSPYSAEPSPAPRHPSTGAPPPCALRLTLRSASLASRSRYARSTSRFNRPPWEGAPLPRSDIGPFR